MTVAHIFSLSRRIESFGPEDRASFPDQFLSGRWEVVEGVVQVKSLPFETAHLVKRQHLHALYIAQTGSELRNLCYILFFVRYSRHEDKAYPDGPSAIGEATSELERRRNVLSC